MVALDARPEIDAADPVLVPGAPVRVRWRNAPGELRDRVGLYRAGEVDVTRDIAFGGHPECLL